MGKNSGSSDDSVASKRYRSVSGIILTDELYFRSGSWMQAGMGGYSKLLKLLKNKFIFAITAQQRLSSRSNIKENTTLQAQNARRFYSPVFARKHFWVKQNTLEQTSDSKEHQGRSRSIPVFHSNQEPVHVIQVSVSSYK